MGEEEEGMAMHIRDIDGCEGKRGHGRTRLVGGVVGFTGFAEEPELPKYTY